MPKQKQATKVQICLRVPPETLAAAREEATLRGKPMSEVFRSVWELRYWIRKLKPNQRFAIVEVQPKLNGQINKRVRVVEFVDLKRAGFGNTPTVTPKSRKALKAAVNA